MLTENAKKTIDGLGKDELVQEICKAHRSRFQNESYAYLKTRLSALEQEGQQIQRQEDVAHRNEELALAREANKFSKTAIAVSVFAALISLGALIVAF